MIDIRKIYIISVFLLVLSSCSTDVSSTSDNVKGNVLLFSTFEKNNQPTLENWTSEIPVKDSSLIFTSDVPLGGGKWAIKLFGGTQGVGGILAEIPLSRSDSLMRYVLSYWGKGKGYTSISLFSSSTLVRQLGQSRNFDVSIWTYFSDTVTSKRRNFDRLDVVLSSELFDSSAVSQYDNVRVLEILPE